MPKLILLFSATWLFNALCHNLWAFGPEECLHKVNFKMPTRYFFGEQTAVEKKDCSITISRSEGGKVLKWSLNVCDSKIQIQYWPTLSTNTPQIILAGSQDCPKPLFGMDQEIENQKANSFHQESTNILRYLKAAQKDPDVQNLQQQFSCISKLVSDYLNQCTAVTGK